MMIKNANRSIYRTTVVFKLICLSFINTENLIKFQSRETLDRIWLWGQDDENSIPINNAAVAVSAGNGGNASNMLE